MHTHIHVTTSNDLLKQNAQLFISYHHCMQIICCLRDSSNDSSSTGTMQAKGRATNVPLPPPLPPPEWFLPKTKIQVSLQPHGFFVEQLDKSNISSGGYIEAGNQSTIKVFEEI